MNCIWIYSKSCNICNWKMKIFTSYMQHNIIQVYENCSPWNLLQSTPSCPSTSYSSWNWWYCNLHSYSTFKYTRQREFSRKKYRLPQLIIYGTTCTLYHVWGELTRIFVQHKYSTNLVMIMPNEDRKLRLQFWNFSLIQTSTIVAF